MELLLNTWRQQENKSALPPRSYAVQFDSIIYNKYSKKGILVKHYLEFQLFFKVSTEVLEMLMVVVVLAGVGVEVIILMDSTASCLLPR